MTKSRDWHIQIFTNLAGPRADYSGFAPLAKALIAANVDRVIWGELAAPELGHAGWAQAD